MKQALTPHITEKAYRGIPDDAKQVSTYTFKLNQDLDKKTIKKLIEREHKVTVTDVRTLNIPGKVRRFKGIVGKTSSVTKAIVRLKKGDRIASFDIDEQKGSEPAAK